MIQLGPDPLRWPEPFKSRYAERLQTSRQRSFSVVTTAWAPIPDSPQLQAYLSPADELLFGGAGGGGKALALNTPLPTPAGWTTMREVQVGDNLLDDQGVKCQVIATSEILRNHKCYAVHFDDGEIIIAGADHQWLTLTHREREQRVRHTKEWRARRRAARKRKGTGKRPDLAFRNAEFRPVITEPSRGAIRTTAEIALTLRVRKRDETNHSIPLAPALHLPRNPYLLPDVPTLPVGPYTLGVWLGDGKTQQGKVYVQDSDLLIVSHVQAEGYTVRNVPSEPIGRTIIGLQPKLRRLGVLGNKHIPDQYLRAPYDDRIALMRGLMDTDGHCDKDGGSEFTSTREVLARGVLELARTLGIKATLSEGRATLRGRDCGPKYRVKLTTTVCLFCLPRKAARQNKSVRPTQHQRYIVDCVAVQSVPVRCVQVNSPSRMYLAGAAMVPTHNSDLLLGLAGTQHQQSIIFRRVFPELRGIIERSREIFNARNSSHSKDSYNESLHLWRLADSRMIEFGSLQHEKDKEMYRGRPHDFYGWDELTEFTESQFRFVNGWNRSTRPNQRCRIVATCNPPTTTEGRWVIKYWAPWIDDKHKNPAMPGELRWFAVLAGEDVEVDGPDPITHQGEVITPRSRTFIPARLADNPYLEQTGYRTVLQGLPEPLRSQMLQGDFKAGIEDDVWQVIPTAWIDLAIERGRGKRPDGPLSALGVDPSRGGRDKFVIASRYDNWIDPLVKHKGSDVPDGPVGAKFTLDQHKDKAHINVDVIGIGSSVYDSLKDTPNVKVYPINNAESTDVRDKTKKYKLVNVRSASYWKLREALDPVTGDNLAFPDDPEMRADLCAPKFKVTTQGIIVEPKSGPGSISERLGRSPDCGDAVVLACWIAPKSGQYAVVGRILG